jgi:predicted nucleotide-binding protein
MMDSLKKRFTDLEIEADNIERSKRYGYNTLMKREQEEVDYGIFEKWKFSVVHLLDMAFGENNRYSSNFIEKKLTYMGSYALFNKLKPIFLAAKDGFYLECAAKKTDTYKSLDLTKVFIVHGRDNLAKAETARFIEKLGFSAIILHEQASSGKTIIEKIEEHTNVGFAVVLYTPCDIGGLADEEKKRSRARQNVVFEHGYLIGKLGRKNVCALVKGDIETPNDISGVVYVTFDNNGAWQTSVAQELRSAGYPVDMNKLLSVN